jgi:hypothetical protein
MPRRPAGSTAPVNSRARRREVVASTSPGYPAAAIRHDPSNLAIDVELWPVPRRPRPDGAGGCGLRPGRPRRSGRRGLWTLADDRGGLNVGRRLDFGRVCLEQLGGQPAPVPDGQAARLGPLPHHCRRRPLHSSSLALLGAGIDPRGATPRHGDARAALRAGALRSRADRHTTSRLTGEDGSVRARISRSAPGRRRSRPVPPGSRRASTATTTAIKALGSRCQCGGGDCASTRASSDRATTTRNARYAARP